MSETLPLPYEGVTVLELAQGVAAPYCGMLFARHGADVIKIEPPEGGDWSRSMGIRRGDLSADAIVLTRGKRSLALDLKHTSGKAIALRLAAKADIVVQNFRPGVIERLGLDYSAVSAINPSVIYLSLSGFGTSGPDRDRPATDSIMQAYAGMMNINREEGGLPRRLDMLAIDISTGLYLNTALAASLFRRARTGKGEHIQTSLLACALAFQEGKMIEQIVNGPGDSVHGAPMGCFQTADGYISMNARRQSHFEALCGLLGTQHWLADPRFNTAPNRVTNAADANDALRPFLRQQPTAYWVKHFEEIDILYAPVATYQDLFASQQVKANGIIRWIDMEAGKVPMAALPGAEPPRQGDAKLAVPNVGADSRAVLAGLGLADEEIAELERQGAVRAG